MTLAVMELQREIFKILANESRLIAKIGENKVFDHVPSGMDFPFICFGKTSLFDWSSDAGHGFEHVFTLHIWSGAKGKKDIFEIMEIVNLCLHNRRQKMDEYHLINLFLDFNEVTYDGELSAYHGVLVFKALTELSH